MSRLDGLKQAASLSDLAVLLGFKAEAVSFILYKLPVASKYTTFQIPKRTGGHRTIDAPCSRLKLLQQRLSDLLQDCLEDINGVQFRKDTIAHGFKRRRSIITNAKQHRHKRWIFNLDLENFFPSINFGRVRGFLIRNRYFLLHEGVATTIAQIACHKNSLPQGSPCSPVISNLLTNLLDIRLVQLASESGCTYSRYADDLTFSTNKTTFPTKVALLTETGAASSHTWLPGKALKEVIERSGFRINSTKTRMMYRHSRQTVTGLVVNEKVNVAWEYRQNVRAMVHKLATTGQFEILKEAKKESGQIVLEKSPGRPNELHGRLGFIDSVQHLKNYSPGVEKFSSCESTYRRFLFYTTFYASPTPVLICEGSTDNVYLTHAIRNLAQEFPELAETANGKTKLKIRIYKYPKSSTARLLGLKTGGSGTLSKFIPAYSKIIADFRGPGLVKPVILLYDNDDGAKSIRGAIKQVSKIQPTGFEPFVRIVKNLYAVATPRQSAQQESKIEDFFDAKIKSTVVDGKRFTAQNDFDPDTYYGKIVFAHKVIKPSAEAIDFKGFRPLLSNISAAINAHKKTLTTSNLASP